MENRLLAAARLGRRPPGYWRVILYLVLSVLVLVLSGIALGLLSGLGFIFYSVLTQQTPDPSAVQAQWLQIVKGPWGLVLGLPQYLLVIGLTWLFVRGWERRPFHTIGLWKEEAARKFIRGGLWGLLMLAFSVAIPAALGMMRAERVGPTPGTSPVAIGLWAMGGLLLFVLQGSSEEIQFRGYVLPVLGAKGHLWVGVVVSALVFGCFHLLNPGVTTLAVFNIALSGIFLALYALREEGLWGVCGWHAAWNWMQSLALGLPVSGVAGLQVVAFADLTEAGPDWLTGGAFGPEGGVAVTAVLLTGILILQRTQLKTSEIEKKSGDRRFWL